MPVFLFAVHQIIGSPSEDELGFITSEKAKRYIRSLPRSERVDFSLLWPQVQKLVSTCISEKGRGWLARLLCYIEAGRRRLILDGLIGLMGGTGC